MGARSTPAKGCTTGNFVAEWFGHRVWPEVDQSEAAGKNQGARTCPFLTAATGEAISCVKRASGWDEPYGVCTISSDSNGTRQDWIACPYRTLDQHFTLLKSAVRHGYAVRDSTEVALFPLTSLHRQQPRERLIAAQAKGDRVFLFSAQKLGGEVDLPQTQDSPGASVDMSVIEVLRLDRQGKPSEFGQHLFYEIQTSDFHGSPLHAAKLLRQCCPKCDLPTNYHDRLASMVEICGTGVEGPNKANIFKRTIYQMLYKIELAQQSQSAGFAIVLPISVWHSWLAHLGRPQFVQVGSDSAHHALLAPDESIGNAGVSGKATVYVFDICRDSKESPSPLEIVLRVSCSAKSLAHHAFTVAASKALEGNVIESFRKTFIDRVTRGWNGRLRGNGEKA